MFEPVKTPQISQIEVLASDLDSPRKLSFGPDGALYVGQLTGFPFQSDIAQVYRINVTTNAEYCSCGNSYKAVS